MIISLALIAAWGCGLGLWNRCMNAKDGETEQAELAEIARIKSVLRAAAFSVITLLERQYGDKTGALKLSGAIDLLLQLIPDKWKGQFDETALTDIVEDALAAAKLKWAKNPILLGLKESPKG
jgi:hypothetical protein